MTSRFSWLRTCAVVCTTGAALVALPAHAGMFDDNEARQAVLDLRAKTEALSSQLGAAQRTILDQSSRLDDLGQQVATLRGQNEELTNQVSLLQKQQRDYYTDLDARVKKFEPQQQTVDGVQGEVQPGETDAYNAAMNQFRAGDFKGSAAAFRDFVAKYPQSPYQPSAQYWLGNALYAQRDYKGSTGIWQGLVTKFPQHPRAPEALLSIANNQAAAARKTLQQIVAQYPASSAAQAAQTKLTTIK
jgi:tol-pal system protein YbgF